MDGKPDGRNETRRQANLFSRDEFPFRSTWPRVNEELEVFFVHGPLALHFYLAQRPQGEVMMGLPPSQTSRPGPATARARLRTGKSLKGLLGENLDLRPRKARPKEAWRQDGRPGYFEGETRQPTQRRETGRRRDKTAQTRQAGRRE